MPNNALHAISGSPAAAVALPKSWWVRRLPHCKLLHWAPLLLALLSPAAALRVGSATSPIAGCKGIECVDRYIQLPDASYSWQDTGLQVSGTDLRSNTTWVGYVLNMTSQTWRLAPGTEVDFPVWWHLLAVVVPANREIADWSNLVLDFGANHPETSTLDRFDNRISEINQRHNPAMAVDGDSLPSHMGDLKKALEKVAYIATRTRALAAGLYQLPNGAELFGDDKERRPRAADGVRGYSFGSFLRHPDEPERITELPITKAAVRAMDTITAFASQKLGSVVSRFGVTGYSKLGTATMLIAAVDPRVKVIVPVAAQIDSYDVMPHDMTKAGLVTTLLAAKLGLVGKMVQAYEDFMRGIIDQTPEYGKLHKIIDPATWADRLRVPQLYVLASQDTVMPLVTEFAAQRLPLLPNGTSFLELPDCTHENSLVTALPSVAAFFRGKILGLAPPEVAYEEEQPTGRLVVRQVSNHTPLRATSWESSNAAVLSSEAQLHGYTSRELEETSPGSRTWAATHGLPVSFIMLEYDWPEPGMGMEPFRISTPAFRRAPKKKPRSRSAAAPGPDLMQLLRKR